MTRSDIEHEIASYCRWIEDQTSESLRPSKPSATRQIWLDRGNTAELLPVSTAARSSRVRWRSLALVAASVLVAVGAVILAQRRDPDYTVPPANSPPPASVVGPVETLPSSTSSVPEAGSSMVPLRACGTDATPSIAIDEINKALMASRQGTAALPDCLEATPDLYTGLPPACWSPCSPALQSFGTVRTNAEFTDVGTPVWRVVVPVTYTMSDGTYLDVWESWQVRRENSQYTVGEFAIENPPVDRLAAAATLNSYLELIDRSQWVDAVTLMLDGGTEPASRPDLQQLTPVSFSIDDLAAALSDWCSSGCDTTEVRPPDLSFEDSFSLARGDSKLILNWFEGAVSIGGLPAHNRLTKGLSPANLNLDRAQRLKQALSLP